jgi:hypothetical protein
VGEWSPAPAQCDSSWTWKLDLTSGRRTSIPCTYMYRSAKSRRSELTDQLAHFQSTYFVPAMHRPRAHHLVVEQSTKDCEHRTLCIRVLQDGVRVYMDIMIALSNGSQPASMLHPHPPFRSLLDISFLCSLHCANNSEVRCYTDLLSPMALLLTTLFLAVSVSARGITEAPSAITRVPEEACTLTNDIPSCGVSRFPLWELAFPTDPWPRFRV